jgi:hypothetical protein
MEKFIEQIGKITPEIWNATVRYQYFKGITLAITGMVAIILFYFAVTTKIEKDFTEGIKMTVCLILGIFGVLCLICTLCLFIYPEYFAYRSLLP